MSPPRPHGQNLSEYALITAAVCVIAAGGLVLLGQNISNNLSEPINTNPSTQAGSGLQDIPPFTQTMAPDFPFPIAPQNPAVLIRNEGIDGTTKTYAQQISDVGHFLSAAKQIDTPTSQMIDEIADIGFSRAAALAEIKEMNFHSMLRNTVKQQELEDITGVRFSNALQDDPGDYSIRVQNLLNGFKDKHLTSEEIKLQITEANLPLFASTMLNDYASIHNKLPQNAKPLMENAIFNISTLLQASGKTIQQSQIPNIEGKSFNQQVVDEINRIHSESS